MKQTKSSPAKLEYMRQYRLANLEQEKARANKWYHDNKEEARAKQDAYTKAHPEVNKAAAKKYREKNQSNPEWRARNAAWARNKRATDPEAKEKARKYATAEYRKKWGTDEFYTMSRKLRNTLRKRLKQQNAKKTATTFDLIGCSIDELKEHLQAQFKSGMFWNNYGAWHIDHIVPISSFDLLDPVQQKLAFSYQNLQPLWAAENMSKSDKIL